MENTETQEMIFEEEVVEIEEEVAMETDENETKYAGLDLDALLEEDDDDDLENEGGVAEQGGDATEPAGDEAEEPLNVEGASTSKLLQLPVARIRQIIRQDPDIDRVNAEAVFVITKATELFLQTFSAEIYKFTARAKKKTIQMRDVNACIDDVCCMQFLEGVFPQNS